MKNLRTVRFSFVALATLTALSCGKVITLGNSTSSISGLLTTFPIVCKAYDLNPMEMTSAIAPASFPTQIPPAPYSTYLGSFSISHFNLPWMNAADGIPGTPDSFHKLVQNFAISCESKIVAEVAGTYSFATINDSSTYVTIDGEYVNPFPAMMDPNYTQAGSITLSAGEHTFRLEYLRREHIYDTAAPVRVQGAHGPNELALQLFWAVPTTPSPTPSPSPSESPPVCMPGIPMPGCPGFCMPGIPMPGCPGATSLNSGPVHSAFVSPVMIMPANTVIVPPSAFLAN